MKLPSRFGLGWLLVALIVGATARAQDYEIRFDRPLKVGSKYHVKSSIVIEYKRSATIEGQEHRPVVEGLTAQIQALLEVLRRVRTMSRPQSGSRSKSVSSNPKMAAMNRSLPGAS